RSRYGHRRRTAAIRRTPGAQPVARRTGGHRPTDLAAAAGKSTEAESARIGDVVVTGRGIRHSPARGDVVAPAPTRPNTHDDIRSPRCGQACGHGRAWSGNGFTADH